jgi:DNA-binding GntR family transcriptional regulator
MTEEDPPIEKPLAARISVFDYLRNEILIGRLDHGKRLVETDLSRALNVSRTPIREAFRKLENEGLVEYAVGRGVTVRQFSPQDIDDMYAIRGTLEGLAARLAAERITKQEIGELKKLLRGITRSYKAGEYKRTVQLHTAFNEAIYRASRNQRLHELASRFNKYTESSQLRSLAVAGRFAEIQQEHLQIVRAIEQKDPDAAEQAVRSHVSRAQQAYVKSTSAWKRVV